MSDKSLAYAVRACACLLGVGSVGVPVDAYAQAAQYAERASSKERSAKGTDAREQARQAYETLEFKEAERQYEEILRDQLAASPAPSAGEVASVLAELALVAKAMGEVDRATLLLDEAVAIDPQVALDRVRFGPPAQRALEDAKKRHPIKPTATLRLRVEPEDARVRVDGRLLSDSETRVQLLGEHRHLVQADGRGYRPLSLLVQLPRREALRIALKADSSSPEVFPSRQPKGRAPQPKGRALQPKGRESFSLAEGAASMSAQEPHGDPGHKDDAKPWYRKTWVWIVVGAVVVAGVTGGVVAATRKEGSTTFDIVGP